MAMATAAFSAEQKNGLQVEVTRKTTGRNDTHDSAYFEQTDRTMALHIAVKNISMRDMPAGSVEYSLLVKKHNYSPPYYELYTGAENLPALKVAEQTDVVVGAAQLSGYRDIVETREDKMDYKIVVKQNSQEMLTITSNHAFDSLAERAHKVEKTKK